MRQRMGHQSNRIALIFVLFLGASFLWNSCGPTTTPPSESLTDASEQGDATEPSPNPETGPESSGKEKEPTTLPEDPTPQESSQPDASAGESNEETTEEAPKEEVAPDDKQPPQDTTSTISLTWWDCYHKQSKLTASEKSFCDKNHTQSPTSATFKIRWYFLYDNQKPNDWIQPRMKIMNEQFRAANITFQTHSITILKNTVLAPNGEHDNTKRFKLQNLKDEMVSMLQLPSGTSAQDALKILKQRLLDNGVTAAPVNAMTLNTTLNNNAFLYRISRVWEREISIYVAKKLLASGGKTPGGYASLPAFNPRNITRGSILLRENYRADALAHEVGHYFGLVHTQATEETLNLNTLNAASCKTYLPNGVASMKSVLQKQLGSNYSKPLGKPFLSYKSTQSEWRDYYALRCAIGRLYISWINTFQKPNTSDPSTWKNFPTFGEFAQHVLDGKKAYQKLFSKVVNGRTTYNCVLGSASKMIECTYGTTKYKGTDALLNGSIAFQNGKASNLMSYLNNPRSFPVRLMAKEQATMLFYHMGSPDRLSLRNYDITP